MRGPQVFRKGVEGTHSRSKKHPVKSVRDLQEYNKGEVEVYVNKSKCDLRNLEEYARALEKRLEENEVSHS
ncbi:hypothetical protein Xbed_02841 [Xenorhabdus beddingii]|uniref:Uncharacterized protein n=1 Tax=Xenorhabdus beddingii TaxID=40578 RepID=A0A1Y2SMK1_9GAMM|nr:hypothetical protein [Xenorhabdus beddingii]OTA18855.1 hypothetical protein Xbed_02841 [Xenorhabdus beddingii]